MLNTLCFLSWYVWVQKAQATPAVPPGEEDEENDDDVAARVGIGVSTEIKVKWRRSSVEGSHSDDSLWKLFSCYGQIETVELTGTKVGPLLSVVRPAGAKAERAANTSPLMAAGKLGCDQVRETGSRRGRGKGV